MKDKPFMSVSAIAILAAGLAFGGGEAKCKFRFPTPEERARMHAETHFPDAKPDTSQELIREIIDMNFNKESTEAGRQAKEIEIVERFAENTYATLPVSKMTCEIDFVKRLSCLREIAKFPVVGDNTDVLFTLAAHIGKGESLPVEAREKDLRALLDISMRMSFTDRQLAAYEEQGRLNVMRAALIPSDIMSPGFSACRGEYDRRESYNLDLKNYRMKALKLLKTAVECGYRGCNQNERSAIWAECLCLARATKDELVLFGKLEDASRTDASR